MSLGLRKIGLVALLLFMAKYAFPQQSKKAVKAYESALSSFSSRDHEKAMQQARKAVGFDSNYAEAWLLLGEIGMETHDDVLAIEGYEHSLAADSMLFPPSALTLAGLYDRQMRYAEEIVLLEWFQITASGNKANDEKASDMLANARFREAAVAHPVDFNPVNLGEMVNSSNDEYVNALDITGRELLFTKKLSDIFGGFPEEGIFVSKYADGQWLSPTRYFFYGEMFEFHAGAAFVSYRGDELFFTLCGMDRHNQGCDLYRATRDDAEGEWSAPQVLDETVNSAAWDSQPCLSLDGKELFFASRRNGNADLYHCFRDGNGQWSEPENLGSVINTPGTEMAPFLHPDGKTLYFSSDTHRGMGGYDLFVSRRDEEGVWSTPVNLGYPINTPGDEINFIVAADGHTALISSIREGGWGGYDIYSFQLEEEELKPESVNVYDFIVEDLSPGTVVRLVNIQFEFNSAMLTADSEEGLAMLAEFLQTHPEIQVELAGHTDNVGSDAYNQTLSEARAEVVRQALVERGLDPKRLSSKGYGASKPICPNDTEEHRARNRRTEMVVL